jgi:hypothetical protein
MTLNNWFTIQPEEYIKAAAYRIKSIWLGKALSLDDIKGIFYITQTEARAVHIQSSQDWTAFIDSCYSLACINEGENWTSRIGIKQHFREWMMKDSIRNSGRYYGFDESKFNDPVLCTAFDTPKQKRLIVDGLNRAYALTIACSEGYSNIPQVTIVECFGNRVDVIFPCDIHQLPS